VTAAAAGGCAIPLVAVDRVLRLDASGVTTEKVVDAGEYFFEGHYPGYAVYPGVFVIEAVHQAVSRYLAASGRRARLEEIRSTRFLAPIRPGEVLLSECRCTENAEEAALEVTATCRGDGAVKATVKLRYKLG
jgi:3-hydroxyacyl-[acyl-carrier-protein] dehydratase